MPQRVSTPVFLATGSAISSTCVARGLRDSLVKTVLGRLTSSSHRVNTACSSSMYAVHNACNAICNGDWDVAVVGGTILILTVDQHMNTATLGVLSPTNTCHTIDESAGGYSRAEGIEAPYINAQQARGPSPCHGPSEPESSSSPAVQPTTFRHRPGDQPLQRCVHFAEQASVCDTNHNDSQSCEADGVWMYKCVVARRTTVSRMRQCKVHWEPKWEDGSEIHDLDKALKD